MNNIEQTYKEKIYKNALTFEQCEKLTAKRLLAYYRKHRKLRHIGVCDCCGEIIGQDNVALNDIANQYLDGVKGILDTKEHVN